MQPNQNVAGTPNQNAAGAAGAAGASPAGVAGVAGAAGVAGVAGAAAAGAGAAGAASVANAPATPNLTKTEPKAKEPEPNIMAQGLSKNKSGKGMLYGLIFCLILAVGGIGFGVWTMMDGNTQKEQLNTQISSLKSQNNELSERIIELEENNAGENTEEDNTNTPTEAKELNGDIALDLLVKAVTGKQLGYGVGYANVYAKYNGNDKVAYWVKYMPTHIINDEVSVAYDIIFTLNDAGEWEFELPGFTGYGSELEAQYTVLREV
ncbi:hypothetical protein J5491_03025 [Candidatus Saccharibacteria bacterium]|nr:hypothetical protein [Candidatus Saccharibacteria bacterium]